MSMAPYVEMVAPVLPESIALKVAAKFADTTLDLAIPAVLKGFAFDQDVPSALITRTNLMNYSESYTNATWTAHQSTTTVEANGVLRVTPSAISGTHAIRSGAGGVVTIGNMVFTVEIKPQGCTKFAIGEGAQTGNFCTYDSATQTKWQGATRFKVVQLEDGWFRVSYKVFDVEHTGAGNYQVFALPENSTSATVVTTSWTPDGTSSFLTRKWSCERSLINSSVFAASSFVPAPYQKVTDWTTEYLAAAANNVTLFQDVYGMLPSLAVEHPVGLTQDRRLALTRGAERIADATVLGARNVNTTVIAQNANSITVQSVASGTYGIVASPSITGEVGKWYEFKATLVSNVVRVLTVILGGSATNITLLADIPQAVRVVLKPVGSTMFDVFGSATAAGQTLTMTRPSFRELPGNHVSQATAAARPVLSARVNMFLGTSGLNASPWGSTSVVTTLAPADANVPDNLFAVSTPNDAGATSSTRYLGQTVALQAFTPYKLVFYAKAGPSGLVRFMTRNDDTGRGVVFNLAAQSVSELGGTAGSVTHVAGDVYRCEFSWTSGSDTSVLMAFNSPVSAPGDGTLLFYVSAPDLRREADWQSLEDYQRVTTATDYDAVGFPHYKFFDGVDDDEATGPMTFSSNMEYFVALYRMTAGALILGKGGLGEVAGAAQNHYFGVVQSGNGSTTTDWAGAPSYYVNGIEVPGGSAVTRDQLHLAIPVGQWCVVEARNLDLSTWAAFGFGKYAGATSPVRIGGQILIDAQTDAQRLKIRQDLAAKYGVVL